MNRILIIEDEEAISELIGMNLEAAGYETVRLMDGLAAQAWIESYRRRPGNGEEQIALALVDVMLPGRDGFALLEDLKHADIPVIFLTAKSDVASRVRGLKSGAEDYMVKPFAVLELLARVEKVLERTGRGRDVLCIRDVKIYRKEHRVTRNGVDVALKPMEYELLVLLASNRNVAFTRQQLLDQVWGGDYFGETRTVDVHIGCLRRKLGFHDVIRTIPKTGYRLEG